MFFAAIDQFDHLARVRAEHAAVVRHLDARDRDRHAIHEPRCAAAEERVLPLLPHAANDIEAFVHLGQELADLLGRILQVGVERDDHVALDHGESGEDGRVLAEVAREFHDHDAIRVPRGLGSQQVDRFVAAAVVHEDDLVGAAERVERGV